MYTLWCKWIKFLTGQFASLFCGSLKLKFGTVMGSSIMKFEIDNLCFSTATYF